MKKYSIFVCLIRAYSCFSKLIMRKDSILFEKAICNKKDANFPRISKVSRLVKNRLNLINSSE